jgi:hypothetical protein
VSQGDRTLHHACQRWRDGVGAQIGELAPGPGRLLTVSVDARDAFEIGRELDAIVAGDLCDQGVELTLGLARLGMGRRVTVLPRSC